MSAAPAVGMAVVGAAFVVQGLPEVLAGWGGGLGAASWLWPSSWWPQAMPPCSPWGPPRSSTASSPSQS
jgi:hypothetical protein